MITTTVLLPIKNFNIQNTSFDRVILNHQYYIQLTPKTVNRINILKEK